MKGTGKRRNDDGIIIIEDFSYDREAMAHALVRLVTKQPACASDFGVVFPTTPPTTNADAAD